MQILTALLFIFLFTGNLSAQLELDVQVQKTIYQEKELLFVDVLLINTTDTTVNLLFFNQESCQAYFSIDDFKSWEWSTCFPTSQELSIPANHTRQYQFILWPDMYGLPTFDGTHKITASLSYYLQPFMTSSSINLTDTAYFDAKMALCGRLYVGFPSENDSLITLLKDSLNVEVSNRSDFTETLGSISEGWQLRDVSIDTVFNELPRGKPTRYQKTNAQGESGIAPRGEVLNQKENKLKDDTRFNYVEINRMLDFPSVSVITSIENNSEESIPSDYKLSQNFPNPFNPTTTINYYIPRGMEETNFASLTKLIIYDILGNQIAVLVNEPKPPGSYSVTFNASKLSSGVYYYRLQIGSSSETKKMVLLR